MHYYQHHIGDFIKDTSFLTNEEVGIYMKLIWLYYDTENPLPKNIALLTAKVNARGKQDVVQNILELFFYESEDYYCHTRCAQVIADYHKQLETASKAGRASAEKRKLNAQATEVQHESNDRSTTVQPTINHKPLTNNHKPIKYIPPIPAELLSEWLAIRKRKPVTERVFNALVKEANKLGWTAEQAVIKCCEKTWTGFEAAWVTKENKPSYQDAREAAARTAFGSLLTNQNNLKVINNE